MVRKVCFVIIVFLMLGLVDGAWATIWTNADANDELWSTPGNWDEGVPAGPDEGDTAQLDNPDVNGPLIRDGIDAVCVRFKGPGYSIPPGSDLTITGGTLTFGRYWRVGFGAGAGIVNMSGGVVTNLCNYEIYMNAKSVFDISDGLVNSGFYLPSDLSLGSEVSTLNMTGGTIDTKGSPNTSHSMQIGVEGGGPGLLNLHGGTVITATLSMGAKGMMDIEKGQMIIDGDVRAAVEGYVNDGLITAYSGGGMINLEYDDVNNVTIVTAASSSPSAFWPSPCHRDEGVCPDAVVSWKAGTYADFHEVYFGTGFNDVNDATTSVHLGVYVGPQDACEYDPTGLLEWGTTYYWRIDEVNDVCAPNLWRGMVWSFTVDSGKARDPGPADLGWRMPVDTQLAWSGGCLAQLHDVYFGTDFDAVNNASNPDVLPGRGQQASTNYDPGVLEHDRTYYWRIDEVGDSTFVEGDVWSFTTIGAGETLLMCDVSVGASTLKEGWTIITKDSYTSDSDAVTWVDVNRPDGSSSGIDLTMDVGDSGNMGGRTWGGEPLGMDYFFANDQSGSPDADFIIKLGNLTPGTYQLTTFHNSTWYGYASGPVTEVEVTGGVSYGESLTPLPAPQTESVFDAAICQVKVEFDATGSDDVTIRYKAGETGVIYMNGLILDYFPPDKRYAYWPLPRNGTKDTQLDAVLSWRPGIYAADPGAHDVYFGTSWDDVNDATTSSSVYMGSQNLDANTYAPPGLLNLGGTYYWRVDEHNDANGNLWKGDVWRFTVADYIELDDFESYNLADNLIDSTWLGGVRMLPNPPYFEYVNGAVIGLGTTYASPPDPVHGGKQSMMFLYDNSGGGMGLPYYSEAERVFDLPQDWTQAKVLMLYYRGDPNNDANATEQMYVGIEDSRGPAGSAEVAYGYYADEDMSDIKVAEWQEWNVALAEFTGVQLNDVNKIYIGFGDEGGTVAGGFGIVYFDDIMVSLPRCVPSRLPTELDFNGDCVVDFGDVGLMAADWLRTDVNFLDLGIVPQAPSTAGLVAWWKLEETDGNTPVDYSGHGYNGVLEGDYDWTGGHSGGTAVDFDNGRVLVGDAPALRPQTKLSVSAWAYYTTEQDHSARIVVKGPDNQETFGLEIDGGDEATFHVRDVNNNRHAANSGVWRKEWLHLAGTFDGDSNTVRCYVNGQLGGDDAENDGVDFVNRGMTTSQDTNDLAIGNRSDADNREFEGAIDDVRLYDYALSEGEVVWLATDGMGYRPLQSQFNLYNAEPLGQRQVINARDFAILADAWLDAKLWPPVP